jgi:Uma2 family endonuclease
MVVQERLYTAEELLRLQSDKHRYELVAGRLIEMSPTGKAHGQLTSVINALLYYFVSQHNLGQVYGAETGFKLAENPDTVYGVDAAFVAQGRRQSGEDFYQGAPDLAVEVVSPGNTQAEMHAKVKDYFGAGSRLVWVIYPKSRAIYVYSTPNDIQVLNVEDALTGGDVLPGFAVNVAEIFAVLDR